jgi:hypothetical protein
MNELIKLMSKTSSIRLECEPRRCDVDSAGVMLPNGRDHYALWNWYVDDRTNKWPGFWNESDCIRDMINGINNIK